MCYHANVGRSTSKVVGIVEGSPKFGRTCWDPKTHDVGDAS